MVQDDQECDKPIRSVKGIMITTFGLKSVQSFFVTNLIFDARNIREIHVFAVNKKRMHENHSLSHDVGALHVTEQRQTLLIIYRMYQNIILSTKISFMYMKKKEIIHDSLELMITFLTE